ncbi:GGDEF domain-containing protein [Thiohalomonas denitrificans]|uniref:GGDEF domain-containing protein n=1 Tax=Thiohalomonas denitrificans TaxID=415747 RepID=UPI0015868E45|nr:GGDEF domain-containing protein [Thiohalomonas denitrificans]
MFSLNEQYTTGTATFQRTLAISRNRVDEKFAHLISRIDGYSDEQELLLAAQKAWQEAWSQGTVLLGSSLSERQGESGAALVNVNDQFLRAVSLLEALEDSYSRITYNRLLQAGKLGEMAPMFLLGAITLALLMTALTGFAFARSILLPISALHQGAQRIGKGDLTSHVTIDSDDELGQLADAFNTMAHELKKAQKELLDQSMRDELTEVKNYRGFLHCLNEELNRWSRYGDPFALILLDLDHFKTVNDTYGHPAGDEALRKVAETIRLSLRQSDCVARYGGEEFAIIVSRTDATGALALAERIRNDIAAVSVETAGATFGISASIGLSSVSEACCTEQQIVSAADRALYEAKRMGRNRVCQT